jgi:hypothetical protein
MSVTPTVDEIRNLDRLLPEEREDVRRIFVDWTAARDLKDWLLADKLRAQFFWWDEQLGSDGLWSPAFEYALNRQRRAFRRMQRYGVSIYPWSIDEAVMGTTNV